ncbi:MAG TPA: hypothetical protein DD377_04535 [Firmicutes bacterium]|nr:hypothetical protein [Bacillota bacterium]
MNNFEYNYHTHTSRCGHACGLDEEYVIEAIKNGYKRMGFSDHVMLPNISQPGMRGEFSLFDSYVNSVNRLKKKYKNQIEIKLGFECEWYGNTFKNYYEDLLQHKGFDYLILGQHCFLNQGRMIFYKSIADEEKGCELYASDLIDGIRSGLFSYVCHPDFFILGSEGISNIDEISTRIALEAKKANIPLEINMGQTRRLSFPKAASPYEPYYPYVPFWKIVKEIGNKIVVGVDAHNPSDFSRSDYLALRKFIKDLNLKVSDDFML